MAVAVLASVMTPAFTSSAQAGELFSFEHNLYHADDGTRITRWVYDQFGNSVPNATCRVYPGVTMGGDVTSTAYVDAHTDVKIRFKFWTRYNEAVAIAKQANPGLSCGQLLNYETYRSQWGDNLSVVFALRDSACGLAANAANHWCTLVKQLPGLKLLDLDLNERCRAPRFNLDAGGNQVRTPLGYPAYAGPYGYTGWHNTHILLDAKEDLIAQGRATNSIPAWANLFLPSHFVLNAPTYVDDLETMGGMAYINPSDVRPAGAPAAGSTYDQYVGMGKTQTITESENYIDAAIFLEAGLHSQHPNTVPDPTKNLAGAMLDIQNRMTTYPTGQVATLLNQVKDSYCTNTADPWMWQTLERWPGDAMSVSQDAFDYMLRAWVDGEVAGHTGNAAIRNFPCYALQHGAINAADPTLVPDLVTKASFFCQYGLIPLILKALHVDDPADPNYCMNQYASVRQFNGKYYYYPPNGWAAPGLLSMNLGCGKEEHLQHFFGLFKDLL
jgi:hypothetical protein